MTTPTTQREADERALRLIQELSRISMSLAADLVQGADYTFQGHDYLDRDSVCERVMRWRAEWDATASERAAIAEQARAAVDQGAQQAAPEVPTHDLLNVLEMARQSLRLGRNEKARGHVGHAIFLLTRAPTAATDQPSAGQVDDDSDDAYDHACELMEAGWRERAKRGVEIGTEGSLCDGICWLFDRIRHLEAHASLTPTAPQAASQQAESEASDAMLEFKTWDELLVPQAATPASASDERVIGGQRWSKEAEMMESWRGTAPSRRDAPLDDTWQLIEDLATFNGARGMQAVNELVGRAKAIIARAPLPASNEQENP